MRTHIALIIAPFLASCGYTQNVEAITCRGGREITPPGNYRLKTVVTVAGNGAIISSAPLRCPNLEFKFTGIDANNSLISMQDISKNSYGSRALIEIDVTGRLDVDKEAGIPLFKVNKVISFSKLY